MYFAFGWGNFAGFWRAYWGARRLGCRVISGGGLVDRTLQDLDLRSAAGAAVIAVVRGEQSFDLRSALSD